MSEENALIFYDEQMPAPPEEVAQVAEESEEQPTEVKTEEVEQGEDEEEAPEPPKKKTGIQRLREKTQRLEAELQAVRDQFQQPSKPQEPTDVKEPKLEDYDSLEAYERDRESYLEHRILKKLEVQQHQQTEKQKQAERDQKINSAFDEARKAHSDFEDLFEEIRDLPVIPAALKAVARDGSALLYELVKDPERYAELARMDHDDQVFEIAALAASLKVKPAAKRVERSKAPEPITPTRPSKAVVSDNTYRNGLKFY